MKKLLLILILGTSALAAQTTRNVDLSWSASASTSVTGYNVQRATSTSGPFTVLNTAPIATTSYVDSTATVGSTYSYQVIAISPACTSSTPVGTACGNSAPSATATTTVPPTPTAVVTVTVVVP